MLPSSVPCRSFRPAARHVALAVAAVGAALAGASGALAGSAKGCPGSGPCFTAHRGVGCENASCCEAVCFIDPLCCAEAWDELCASSAAEGCALGGPNTCIADLSNDGAVDGFDLGILLAEWSQPGTSVADINDDGTVGGADLGIVLGAWGPCPAPVGPCCLGFDGCTVLTEEDCAAAGGFLGELGATCDEEQISLPEFPTSVRLYSVSVPTVDAAYATAVAESAFNLVGTTTEDAYAITVTGDDLRSLVVYKASAALDYMDEAKLWNASYPGPSSTAEEAIAAALDLVVGAGLAPVAVAVVEASLETVKDVASESPAVPNHWRVRFQFYVDALEGLASDPLLLRVDGAEMEVRVGAANEIVGFYRTWRDLTPAATMSARTEEEAFALAEESEGFAPACPRTITMRYTLYAETTAQATLAPDYLIETKNGHGGGAPVPATGFSPLVRFTTPSKRGTFAPGETIPLEAEIVGGTPPYDVEWIDSLAAAQGSAPEGIIANGNPAAAELGCGTHSVTVRVTDGNGMIAEDTRKIAVTGRDDECFDFGTRAAASMAVECVEPEPATLTLQKKVRGCHGWSMNATVTASNGLELTNVTFRGSMMARQIMLPFYRLETAMMPIQGAELKHPPQANATGNCRSVLQNGIRVNVCKDFVQVLTQWCIDRIPAGESSGHMGLDESYYFGKATTECAKFDGSTCARFWPYVKYRYTPPAGVQTNNFKSFAANQRLDFDVPISDIAAFHMDPDDVTVFVPVTLTSPALEMWRLMANSGAAGNADNYHQRVSGAPVGIPGCSGLPATIFVNCLQQPLLCAAFCGFPPPAFCPVTLPAPPYPIGTWSCVHIHWRWDSTLGAAWGGAAGAGSVLPPASQAVYFHCHRWHANETKPAGLVNPLPFENKEPIGATPRDLANWHETQSNASTDCTCQNDWFFR